MVKRLLIGFASLLLIIMIGAGYYLYCAIPIGTGYTAKYICSATFISKRDPLDVFKDDVAPVNILATVIHPQVDYAEKIVKVSALEIFTRQAVYRDDCGCTLVVGTNAEVLQNQRYRKNPLKPLPEEQPWPLGRRGPIHPKPGEISMEKLHQALENAFLEPDAGRFRQTRAIVIVYDGHLIAERYAPGYHKDMPMFGWSMSKSIVNALCGILVQQNKLNIKDRAPVPEWHASGDPRQAITLDQMLRMSSGLKFREIYQPLFDATEMLYQSHDFAAFAAAKSLVSEPDSRWAYSSGTSNILSRVIRDVFQGSQNEYLDFVYRELFGRLGMHSVVVELDASGTIVGSSYSMATGRDWARFGQLYLQDGVWNGERLLPQGWVAYSTTPNPRAPQGLYGAHFWLNAGTSENPKDCRWPQLPRDLFWAQGYQGQNLTVIPSKRLVIVRLGLTTKPEAWDQGQFIAEVLEAFF